MITSPEVYRENHAITIVFNKEESRKARLLRAFRDAFSNAYAVLEDLDKHRCCLHVRRGGLRKVRR
jgi:hypothetical protein